jgi:hypothetical protein
LSRLSGGNQTYPGMLQSPTLPARRCNDESTCGHHCRLGSGPRTLLTFKSVVEPVAVKLPTLDRVVHHVPVTTARRPPPAGRAATSPPPFPPPQRRAEASWFPPFCAQAEVNQSPATPTGCEAPITQPKKRGPSWRAARGRANPVAADCGTRQAPVQQTTGGAS